MATTYTASGAGSETYTLGDLEWRHAVMVADWMRDKAIERGSAPAHGMDVDDDRARADQRRGEIGAVAVAAVLGIYYPSWVDKFDHPDLPHNIEVRAVAADHYGLRVRERDNGTRRGVLVVVPDVSRPGPCRVVGWIGSLDKAKRPEWMIRGTPGRPPMYAVPQGALEPIERLRALCASETWYGARPTPGMRV